VSLKNRQQLLTVLAGVAVGLFIVNKVVIDPLTGAWRARNTQIAELRKKVADGQSLLNREQRLRDRWRDMRTNALTNDSSAAEQKVISAVDHCASDSRASITAINNQWKHDSDDYMTLECRVEAAGDMSSLAHFLYNLEKDPMALKLQSVEMGSRDNTGRQLTLGLQISGLVLTPQEKRR
jgi:cell division protein FtsB